MKTLKIRLQKVLTTRVSLISAGILTLALLTAAGAARGNPILTITSPIPGLHVSNAVFTARGTVEGKVASVWYQLNGGAWTLATGTNAWTATNLVLTAGTNLLKAYAVGITTNYSATNMVKFFYVPSSALRLSVSGGQGTFYPDYNGKLLAIGQSYTVTSIPAPGYGFVLWIGTGLPPIFTKTIKFTMAEGMELTANLKDIARPVDVITMPAVAQIFATNVVNAAGKSKDNVGVTSVMYQLNGGGWNPAGTTNGYTNWVATNLVLNGGANVLQAFAMDGAGNASLTNSVKFYCIGAPPSIAGMKLIVGPALSPVAVLSFGTNRFSQTGLAAFHTAGVGSYVYATQNQFNAELVLTYDNPPTATNEPSPDIELDYTAVRFGGLTNTSVVSPARPFTTAPAVNLAPASLAGRTLAVTKTGGGTATAVLRVNGTFTTSANPRKQEYGNYTYATSSPADGLLTLTYEDPGSVGAVNYVQLNFTGPGAGNLILVAYHADGSYKETSTGTFTVE